MKQNIINLSNYKIMANNKYGMQSFTADVNGVHYSFEAWTTDTKVSYLNRTWESFRYETCLHRAIDKCPKEDMQKLTDILIYRKREEDHEKAEKFAAKFEKTINKLTPENRQRLADSVGIIETEEQAQAVMGIASLMALMQ